MPRKILLSIVAILTAFFSFWGVCILAALLAGKHLNNAFPQKILFLGVVTVMQIGIIASHPIRDHFHLWLRICSVAGIIILVSCLYWIELIRFHLVDPNSMYLWVAITVVFTLVESAYLASVLKRRISGSISKQATK